MLVTSYDRQPAYTPRSNAAAHHRPTHGDAATGHPHARIASCRSTPGAPTHAITTAPQPTSDMVTCLRSDQPSVSTTSPPPRPVPTITPMRDPSRTPPAASLTCARCHSALHRRHPVRPRDFTRSQPADPMVRTPVTGNNTLPSIVTPCIAACQPCHVTCRHMTRLRESASTASSRHRPPPTTSQRENHRHAWHHSTSYTHNPSP